MKSSYTKYYLDACIWIDLFSNRVSYINEPLGKYAQKLISLIKARSWKIVITPYLITELEKTYSLGEVSEMLIYLGDTLEWIDISAEQYEEAEELAISRDVPKGDALHAIIARDYKLIFVTRDKHFRKLSDISLHYKPEDII